MAIRTELNLRLPNSPGALAGVFRVLAGDRVRVLAMSLDASGLLRLVVDNPVRAVGVLRERRHPVSEREVLSVTVAPAPGALDGVLALLADAGINVEYAYAAAPETAGMVSAFIGVEDVVRAATVAGA